MLSFIYKIVQNKRGFSKVIFVPGSSWNSQKEIQCQTDEVTRQ